MTDPRPSPEQLLERAQREAGQEERARLKIYLGAAPGVGKTYEMLQDALAKREQGLDVVVAIAESHGRKEVERLLKHFEILPRQRVVYREMECMELDLDAALQRSPALILVDEMAHSNPPGLRHRKRWQDIRELLDRGIDVCTTLNVQHIESLKDDVAQIIQAPIKETVPDSMIERADTIELVDLPPEDLLRRLQEGKIYFPDQARLAGEHFFRRGNLIALRELALLVTAKRVDTDVLWYRQGEGIKEIWPLKDKILVCVGPKSETLKLIRGAKRLANSLQVDWLALYISTPPLQSLPEAHNRAMQNLRLAELLGAETHVLTGSDIVKEVIHFAHEQNVTQIMIWKTIRGRWSTWFRRSLADEILRHSREIDVYIMTGSPVGAEPVKKVRQARPWAIYGLGIIIVTLASLLNALLYPVATGNLIMVYLLGVAIVALFGRIGPSLLTTILSVMAYDFFFTPPYYSFEVANTSYFLTLLLMLIVAQFISHFTILIRRQAESAQRIQHQTTALYTFSRKLTRTRGIEDLLKLGVDHIAQAFDSEVMALLPKNRHLEIQAASPQQSVLDPKEQSIAQWVYDMKQSAGFGTDTLSSSKALYLPLMGTTEIVGVLRVQSHEKQLVSPEQKGLLDACINQLTLALEVDHLYEKTRKREVEIEKDRARLLLLASIFHDLSFPLKRVIKALSALKAIAGKELRTIEENIDYEMNKLNRLNDNLFQFIQFETEEIKLKKEACSLKKLIDSAIKIAEETREKRPVQVNLPAEIPLIHLDGQLIQEVLIHLFDNAIKFSPENSPIHVVLVLEEKKMILSIEDFGSGIIPSEKDKVFKKFYRGKQALSTHGLGLGLAICEKIINAHKGRIWVENVKNQGASFRFSIPL